MTIQAVVERLVLTSPDPAGLAHFYGQAFGYQIADDGTTWRCEAQHRSVWVRSGAACQLVEVRYRFERPEAFDAFQDRLRERDVPTRLDQDAIWVTDPDGRQLCFHQRVAPSHLSDAGLAPARLQHYAVRTPRPQVLVDFYADQLGFVVSDLVRDDAGDLGAAFLRTDPEHHAFAIFRSPENRFDHFSCETSNWDRLRDWADRMSEARVPLAWGVGRHGPGNDLFFMVKDPDGNMAEISTDLEVCADDRPTGLWRHEARTLNLWGVAIMRS